MKKRPVYYITAFILCVGMLSGCGIESTKLKDNDGSVQSVDETDVSFVDFSELSLDEFADSFKQLKIDENTLLIGTDVSYSLNGINSLNSLLQENGLDFQVFVIQLPDDYLNDGMILEMMDYFEEHHIEMDIMPLWIRDVGDAAEAGYLYDLTDYFSAGDGEELKNFLPDLFWEVSDINGHFYGPGTVQIYAEGWSVDEKLMKNYNLSIDDLTQSVTDMEQIFEAVNNGDGGDSVIPFAYIPGYFIYSLPVYLPDESLPVGYWLDSDDTGQVKNIFDTDEMYQLAQCLNTYYEKGYVDLYGDFNRQQNFLMCPTMNTYPIHRSDALDTWTDQDGHSFVRISYYEPGINNLSIRVNTITSWAKHKEAAEEFFSFIYMNQDASELLIYGEEGEDYIEDETGLTACNGLSEYEIFNRSLGSLELCRPLYPYEDEGKTELMVDSVQISGDTDLIGFRFDETNVQEETDAVRAMFMNLSNIQELFAFASANDRDAANWEEYYVDFQKQLQDAGVEKIVDEMNKQLQEYLNDGNID